MSIGVGSKVIGDADESSFRSPMGVAVRWKFREKGVERKWRLQRQTNFLMVREMRGSRRERVCGCGCVCTHV